MRGHDQPRRTESALDRSGRDVRLLHRMQGVAVGESLHCLDASALGLAGRDQAGADQRAVQVDRAGATLALFAGVLRAGEPEPLAQHIEQALALPDPVGLPGLAVHLAVQLHVSSSDSPPRPNPARGRPTRTGHASGTPRCRGRRRSAGRRRRPAPRTSAALTPRSPPESTTGPTPPARLHRSTRRRRRPGAPGRQTRCRCPPADGPGAAPAQTSRQRSPWRCGCRPGELLRPGGPGDEHGGDQLVGRQGVALGSEKELADRRLPPIVPRLRICGDPTVQGRHRQAGQVIDELGRVGELAGWSRDDDALRLGAGLTYTIAAAELVDDLPGLAMAARTVGSPQIRNRGTIGGNLGSASPAGDAHPPLLAAGAEVELASAAGSRRVPIREFFLGPKRNALAPDELIAAVLVPRATGPQQFAKVGTRNAMVIAVCSFALALHPDRQRVGTGTGPAGPVPLVADDAERFCEGALAESDLWSTRAAIEESPRRRFGKLVAAPVHHRSDSASAPSQKRS